MKRTTILLALAALTACGGPDNPTHLCSSRTDADHFVMAVENKWGGEFSYTDHNGIEQVIDAKNSAQWECLPVTPEPGLEPAVQQ